MQGPGGQQDPILHMMTASNQKGGGHSPSSSDFQGPKGPAPPAPWKADIVDQCIHNTCRDENKFKVTTITREKPRKDPGRY